MSLKVETLFSIVFCRFRTGRRFELNTAETSLLKVARRTSFRQEKELRHKCDGLHVHTDRPHRVEEEAVIQVTYRPHSWHRECKLLD